MTRCTRRCAFFSKRGRFWGVKELSCPLPVVIHLPVEIGLADRSPTPDRAELFLETVRFVRVRDATYSLEDEVLPFYREEN